MYCLNCSAILKSKWSKKYCNRSCAATVNNKVKIKRSKKEKKKCKKCNNKVEHNGVVHCKECINNKNHYHGIPAEEQTIEFASRRGGANKYDLVRAHARRLYKKELKGSCERCAYDRHVELCHIKPISSFNKQTLIAEVNERKNVMFLCPNCHWEHDN
jgi:hypothetical protein